jgi:hypothetical protein
VPQIRPFDEISERTSVRERNGLRLVAAGVVIAMAAVFSLARGAPVPSDHKPTFYQDILPILQDRCQVCHRPGGIAPMPLMTYQNVSRHGSPIPVSEDFPTTHHLHLSKSN